MKNYIVFFYLMLNLLFFSLMIFLFIFFHFPVLELYLSHKEFSEIKIEILVPDFRSKIDDALSILAKSPPDVFNHNLESIPRLYKKIRPGADYSASLLLIKKFKEKKDSF